MISTTYFGAPRMKFGKKRLARAREMRDAAVAIVRQHGAWRSFGDRNEFKVLVACIGSLEISYRTPFQRSPEATNLPYGIDVVAKMKTLTEGENQQRRFGVMHLPPPIRQKKVLNIEWSDDGEEHIANFRSGAWEIHLLRLFRHETRFYAVAHGDLHDVPTQ